MCDMGGMYVYGVCVFVGVCVCGVEVRVWWYRNMCGSVAVMVRVYVEVGGGACDSESVCVIVLECMGMVCVFVGVCM